MIKELQTTVFALLRDSVGFSQTELAVATALSRSTLQRILTGQRLPTPEEEEAIFMATDSTLLSVAELVCKVLGDLIGRRVTIVADEVGYQAATPEGELHELLRVAYEKMPRDRWWAWKERVGRFKAFGQQYEAQGFADVRDLRAEVKVLFPEEQEAESTTATERAPAARQQKEGGNMLPFRKS